MSLGGPNIYPGVLTWLGLARELTVGTTVNPVITHPLDQSQFEPEDTPKFLDDKAIRGSMTDLFYKTLGVESASFSFGGPNFLDSHGYFFDNVFGDLSTTGTSPANPATTSGVIPVGSTSFTLSSAPPSAYTAGAVIQLGASPTAEVVVITSTAASNVVNFGGYPLRFTHPTAQTVNTVTSPFCVDEQTEIFTADGWRTVHELTTADEVLTLNHATGMSEWQPVQEVCVFPAEKRELVRMEGYGHSSLTTPNHRWPVITRSGNRVWRTTETLNCGSNIQTAAMCASLPQEAKYTDAFVEVIGWYWTEGDIRSPQGRITQALVNSANVARIDAALRAVFGEPRDELMSLRGQGIPAWARSTEDNRLVRFRLNRPAREQLEAVAPACVVSPEFLRSLTQSQLELFIKVSMLADNCGPTRLAQNDRARAEAFQFAATLAGYGTSLLKRVYKPRESVPATQDGNYTMWGVTLHKRRSFNPVANARAAAYNGNPAGSWVTERVKHEGLVWCPRTPNGTWFARRNGQCYFTGNTHVFAALNSPLGYGGAYGAQPPTHTFTDVTNIVNVFTSATYGTAPTNTFGARQYPSAVLKSLDFSGNAEQLLSIKMAGDSWLSTVATSAVTNVTTNSRPIPNWNSTVVIAGNTVSSTGNYAGIGEFNVSFKRATQTYWIVAGTQTPYVIGRGPLTLDGTIQWDPTNSETPLDLMLLNAQAPMSITVTNSGIPNSGTPFTLTFNANQVANTKSKIMRNKLLVGYQNTFEAISNSTNVGGSGGLGPGTITLINNVSTYLQVFLRSVPPSIMHGTPTSPEVGFTAIWLLTST